jgi:hypothetical protein
MSEHTQDEAESAARAATGDVTDGATDGGALDALAERVRACRLCPLPHAPRPVLRVSPTATLLTEVLPVLRARVGAKLPSTP